MKHCLSKGIGALFIEQNIRKCKWLLCGLYYSPFQKDQHLFDNTDQALDVYSNENSYHVYSYEKIILGGNFNGQIGKN